MGEAGRWGAALVWEGGEEATGRWEAGGGRVATTGSRSIAPIIDPIRHRCLREVGEVQSKALNRDSCDPIAEDPA